MKLATFVVKEQERFGLVIRHPKTAEDWIFDPELAEAKLRLYSSKFTSPLVNQEPSFLATWPKELVHFLELGEKGMAALQRLETYLKRFLAQSDEAVLIGAGFPLATVKLRAPIPRPRLFFGLVQNSPTFIRNNPARLTANVYPQGHQRPQGSLLGPGDPVIVTPEMSNFNWTPEPGIIIGKRGKDILATEAKQYIAGYTLVMDLVHDHYMDQLREHANGETLDWFEEATGSWLGKKSDCMGAMGPFVVTPDEIGNPYDLLLYTRQSGLLRDRAHTGSMLIGFERAISWLSSFIEVYPGDVIHMGTLAFDGMFMTKDMSFGPDDYIESELEQVGSLRLPIVMQKQQDWRSDDDPSRIHSVPAARDLIEVNQTELSSWLLEQTRHYWTVFANYKELETVEGLKPRQLPRVLNAPASALALSGSTVKIPKRAQTISVGLELAFVIKKLAYRVSEAEAADYILGYSPLIVLEDSSFADVISLPATPQELNLPSFYARWPDGFNVISKDVANLEPYKLRNLKMHLAIEETAELITSTSEYLLLAPEIIAFLTQEITLFPGDVITLGRTREKLTLPVTRSIAIKASVEGIAQVDAIIEG
ncbi:MAG: fumarylacetoacetate hydrolase family protein [Trueperaceae bacterium]|nr:fumarylacetoacetate hydrolase family protein [Trueperaceae bacterium]